MSRQEARPSERRSSSGRTVDARQPWSGGAATAVVAALGWEVADISLGLALSFGGDLAGAEAALRDGLRGDGWFIARVIGLGQLALFRLDQGHAEEAEAITADAERHPGHAARIAAELYGGSLRENPALARELLQAMARPAGCRRPGSA